MSAKLRRWSRPCLEALEDRWLPSTFTVTNLKDDGSAGCLRSRITAANNHPGADTVVFAPGLAGTVRLTGGEIGITDDLRVIGPGAALIAVDGNASDRLFFVNDFNIRVSNVTIQGLELRDGKTTSAGGAILSDENLTLIQDVIDANQAAGGAIVAYGKLTIKKSTISGNSSSSDSGGVFFGGGGTLTVKKSVISDNSATGSGVRGGGLFVDSGTATVSNSVISGNTATGGGGLFSNFAVNFLTITASTISGNRAVSGSGGGLFSEAGQTTTSNSIISGNTASGGVGGGGVYSTGPLTIQNSQIRDNQATDQPGGGIKATALNTFLSVTLSGCTISGNTATKGGGVYATRNLTIDSSTISGNVALTKEGGGVYLSKGTLTLTDSTISANHADSAGAGKGGGLELEATAASTISGCTIAANTSYYGGGLALLATTGAVTLSNSTITANRASSNIGAIGDDASSLTVQNCTVAFNVARDIVGGIHEINGTVHLQSTIVAENSAGNTSTFSPDVAAEGGTFDAAFCLIGDARSITDLGSNIIGEVPLLAPLASNGGPTQTLALKKGSPCINHGSNPANSPFDQRGAPFARQLGSAVDIGAYERQ